MPDIRRTPSRNFEAANRRSRVLSALVVMALGIGALGAYSFASQETSQPKSLPLTPSAIIRTTPDAPHEVPPPVEQGGQKK